MNQGGDVAEQVLRMSLNGVEITAKITGSAAKQIAILLYTLLKQQHKTKGPMFMRNMLRSGKELRMFALQQPDLKRFCEEAKHYGIVYSVIRSPKAKDGLVEIMVRAEDAARLNSIFERFNLGKVDLAQITTELEKSIAAKEESKATVVTEKDADALVHSMLGADTAPEASAPPENPMQAQENPSTQAAKSAPARERTLSPVSGAQQKNTQAQTENASPSAPSSRAPSEKQTSFVERKNTPIKSDRPSVRKELAAISEQRSRNISPIPLTQAAPVQAATQKITKSKGR